MAGRQAPEGAAAATVRHPPAVKSGLALVLDVPLTRGVHPRGFEYLFLPKLLLEQQQLAAVEVLG